MLTVTPIDFAEANAFVATLHRHHKPMPGCKFCIAVSDADGKVRGVVMVGRPVARNSDNGYTLEVNRCCTDGARNACSMLYGAAWRVAKALGYRRLMTYTLPAEGGVSLRAAGWKLIGERGGEIGTCQAALASIPQKSCKDRNYYGKRYEAPPHHRGTTWERLTRLLP